LGSLCAMHFIWGLCRRALSFVRVVTSRAVAAVRSFTRPLSGKGFRPVLLVGAPVVALAATMFGYLHLASASAPASASSRHPVRRTGPHDWWGTAVGTVSPVGSFVDDAARTRWYATLLFDAPHPQGGRTGGGHYVHGSSTGACGGATNGADQYVARESGGDPGAVNQGTGAYGCYQIMPGTWGASCSDLGPQSGSSATTQAQCASRLPASAWAG
jgi:Transglycosylase-like domain